jgi:hypothetical protein
VADSLIGPGTVLAGRFVLEDLLDESGGAKFWRAMDRTLARHVTVHVVERTDPRAHALITAARTSATVTDGHLLRVLDAAAEDGIAYVVNEWGSGLSLDRLVADGPLPPRRAAWIAKEVAEAIVTAHRHGIAHGRLLAENVVVTEAGSVKLIGFVVDAVLRGRKQVVAVTGRPLGEHEADVVNLAALLYAGLVGKWPGTEGSQLPPAPTEHDRVLRPRQVRAGVPRPLDAICDRVLNHGGRNAVPIETAQEVYAALCDYIGDPTAAAQAAYEPTTVLTPDPEATQAAVPVFDDDPPQRRPPPPPPPPLPEPEPRPLFAPGPPRPQTEPGGTGSLPPVWGPDADLPGAHEAGAHQDWSGDQEPPGRSWLRLAAAVAACIVLVVALVLAFGLGRRTGDQPAAEGSTSPSPSATAGRTIPIVAVSDFDPLADPPEENGQDADLAHDGDPSTAWRTSTYYNNPKLGGLKAGVGLLLDLGEVNEVGRVGVRLVGEPTSLQLLAAPEDAAAPTGIDGLRRLDTVDGAGTDVDLRLDQPVRTRYLVVWLTSLPPYADGYAGQVAEVTVRT